MKLWSVLRLSYEEHKTRKREFHCPFNIIHYSCCLLFVNQKDQTAIVMKFYRIPAFFDTFSSRILIENDACDTFFNNVQNFETLIGTRKLMELKIAEDVKKEIIY